MTYENDGGLTEREEISILGVAKELIEAVGMDAYVKAMVALCMPYAEEIRVEHPDHPILFHIDEELGRQRGFSL